MESGKSIVKRVQDRVQRCEQRVVLYREFLCGYSGCLGVKPQSLLCISAACGLITVELNRFAGLSGRGDFRDWGPDFCFHPQCEETEDDTPSATDDHRHAGAWLFPSNPPGLSAGGSRLGQVLSPAARPA